MSRTNCQPASQEHEKNNIGHCITEEVEEGDMDSVLVWSYNKMAQAVFWQLWTQKFQDQGANRLVLWVKAYFPLLADNHHAYMVT